jgi:hypothetical protein
VSALATSEPDWSSRQTSSLEPAVEPEQAPGPVRALDSVRVPDQVRVMAQEWVALALVTEWDLVAAQAIRYSSGCPRWSSEQLDCSRIPPRTRTG